jgi:hypothetical protein
MLTFREFYGICEGKKPNDHPYAVPDTYQEKDGVKTYTLKRDDAPKREPIKSAKKITKMLDKQGGIGGKAIKKAKKIEEQHPIMQPNEYNKQVARQSARWKGMQIRQAHGEMEHQAGAELAAKRSRLKSIMSDLRREAVGDPISPNSVFKLSDPQVQKNLKSTMTPAGPPPIKSAQPKKIKPTDISGTSFPL